MRTRKSNRRTSPRLCKTCNRSFPARLDVIARGDGNYCSRSCARADQSFPTIPIEIRFWKYVNKNGPIPLHCPELGPCWIWTGSRGTGGYGRIRLANRKSATPAHHVALLLTNGALPTKLALHKCDAGALGCVRPDHLFEGTHADNVADMIAKGRKKTVRGSSSGMAVLTEAAVLELRALYADGELSHRQLANRYGVSDTAIGYALRRHTWKHVK